MEHGVASQGDGEGAGEVADPPNAPRPGNVSASTESAGGIDPFDLLGLPPRFDLDASEIDRAWIRLAAACHPDRVSDPVEAVEASARSAQLNEARATLRDPERRADRLLRRLGGPAAADETSLPPTFLAEVLEVRERVEEARGADGDVRREIEKEVVSRRDACIARVASLFLEGGGDSSRLRRIRLELNVWRYHERLLAELRGTASAR